MCMLSDEDGNINPYATYPFSRSAESPPGRLMSQADGQRLPLTSHVDNASAATSVRRPERLETVRRYFDVSLASVIRTWGGSRPHTTECVEMSSLDRNEVKNVKKTNINYSFGFNRLEK